MQRASIELEVPLKHFFIVVLKLYLRRQEDFILTLYCQSHSIFQVKWRLIYFVQSVLKGLGLTHPQFVVLATVGWLTKNDGLVTQVAIGKMAGLDPNTNSQIIKGLEQKQLIQRAQSSDGRAKNISLTPGGSEILKQALPAVEKADSNFFNLLNVKELNLLTQTFQKLVPKGVTD
jgi:DNA-binding MarR family transcriptional regulator